MNMNAISLVSTIVAMVLCSVALLTVIVILFCVGLSLIEHANKRLDESLPENRGIANFIIGILGVLVGSFMVILGFAIIIAIIIVTIMLLA